jgi:hypothetical protein
VLLLNERNIIWNPVTYTYKNNIDKAWTPDKFYRGTENTIDRVV